MQIKKLALAVAIPALILGASGCSRKQIDVDETGSVKVEGTNWWRFCDGPNAVMWTKGLGGDSDEIEAYVYDHWACAPNYYGDAVPGSPSDPGRTDEDGLLEDEEN